MLTWMENAATSEEPRPGSVDQSSSPVHSLRINSRGARRLGIGVMVVLLLIAAFLFGPLRSSQRFNYDESDYMYAVSKGFRANYLDEPTLSPVTFLQKGLQALHSSNWSSLSEFIRQSDDISFYRHYHGPLHFYSILAAEPLLGKNSERSLRLVPFAELLLAALILFFGSLLIVPRSAALAGCLSGCFLLISPNNIQTAMWLTPHTLYTATALMALFMMAKLVQSNRLSYLYASVLSIAIAFTVIEYAVLLLVTLLALLVLQRRSLFPEWRVKDFCWLTAKCIVLFLTTIVVLWPGGVYRLTLAKDYLFFLYFTTVRSAAAYGTDSLAHVWWLRIRNSPLEFTVLIVFSTVFLRSLIRRKYDSYLLPFAIYGLLVFLTTVRNRSSSPFYVSSLLPPLYFIVVVLIADLFQRRPRAAFAITTLVVAAFLINGYLYAYRPLALASPDPAANGIVEVLGSSMVKDRNLLVPHDYLPTAHYYFPSNKFTAYPKTWSVNQLCREIEGSRFDGLVYSGQQYDQLQSGLLKLYPALPLRSVNVESPDGVIAYIPLGHPPGIAAGY